MSIKLFYISSRDPMVKASDVCGLWIDSRTGRSRLVLRLSLSPARGNNGYRHCSGKVPQLLGPVIRKMDIINNYDDPLQLALIYFNFQLQFPQLGSILTDGHMFEVRPIPDHVANKMGLETQAYHVITRRSLPNNFHRQDPVRGKCKLYFQKCCTPNCKTVEIKKVHKKKP